MPVETSLLVAADGTRLWAERRTPAPRPSGSSSAGAAPNELLLCAPGGRNAAYWPDELLEAAEAAGFAVVRFDWRQQGRSDWPPGPPTLEQLLDDVELIHQQLVGPGALHVVGVGLGGVVAAGLARRLRLRPGTPPAKPAVVVLIGTSGWYSDPSMPGPTEPAVVSLVLRRRGGGPAEPARAIAREVAVEVAADGPLDGTARVAEVQRWLDHGFNPDDAHRVAWLAAPSRWHTPLEAGRVVVIHGGRDPVVPLAHGSRLAAELAAELVVVPGGGHHLDPTILGALRGVLFHGVAG